MNKKILIYGAVLLLAFFCGCKASKYNEAMTLYENQEYEEAVVLLLEVQDYKDSSEVIVEILDEYAENLEKNNKYDDAIQILNKFSYLHDFSSKITDLTQEKEKYVTYCEAKELLESKKYEEGIEILKELGNNYRNTKKIITSYDNLYCSSFIGNRSVVAKAITGTQYKMDIKITFEYKNEEFYLNVYKTVKTMDGYLMTEKEYDVYYSDIRNNTIQKGKYTWKMENGTLVETDSGSTYIYR